MLCGSREMPVFAETSKDIAETSYLTVPVEKEYVYRTFQLTEDPYSRYQWALQNLGNIKYHDLLPSGYWGRTVYAKEGIDIDLEEGLSYFKEKGANREIIVAIIDTGVDTKQEDLQGHLWKNELEEADGKDSDGNGLKDDLYGWNFYDNSPVLCDYDAYSEEYEEYEDDHGTHCAGTIIATSNNHIGVAGIADSANVKILPIKALGGEDGEEAGEGYTSSIVQAIQYAEQMGAQICNLSFGGDSDDPVLREVMEQSDMLFVCAAGNDGRNIDSKPAYPAAYELPNVISVANLNGDGTLAASSNYGTTHVDLAAPGSNIVSTLVGDRYGMKTGTSMAAPMVTGAAALLYSFHDSMNAEDAKELLLQSVTPLEQLKGKVKTGGMLNVNQLLHTDYEGTTDMGAPKIQLEQKKGTSTKKRTLSIQIKGKRGLEDVRIVKGDVQLEEFQNTSLGTKLKNTSSQVTSLTAEGVYTVYARDRAGMEQVETIQVTMPSATQVKVANHPSKIALLKEN